MMEQLRIALSRLPIKWRIVLMSTVILCLLFVLYNAVQFVTIRSWLTNQEQLSMKRTLAQIDDYFQEKKGTADPELISKSQSYLEKWIEKKQLIRILDQSGTPVVTVSNHLPTEWVEPESVQRLQQLNIWHEDEHLLVLRGPIATDQFRGTIEIINNLELLDHISDLILFVMLAAAIGSVFLSGLGGLVLSKQLLTPIQSLAETIQNIKTRGMHERVRPMNNNDELSRLAWHFNDMMDQLEAAFQQQKQFVEDASHELRTPLTIMKGHLSLLQRWGKDDPEVLDISLEAALQEFQRMDGIVQELLELTRAETQPATALMESVSAKSYIQHTLNRFAAAHPSFTVESELEMAETETIAVVPFQLEQILLILLDNAVKYSSETFLVRVEGKRRGAHVEINVIDFGMGIPDRDVPYVFDRFYRVDKARSRQQGGTGLGLSIAKRLVERNQGQISITSKENEGTTVTVRFPLEEKRLPLT
ncbi:sensor histidine kinase [Paenibacillus cremeus]|uniref:Signal transduction histidine-protein kinase ArlS n=1 Tax=Paenibacillus cremeus TaxID=2163881 RepID=A0A559K9T8_9BACL|nr:HAMP domain-containing histidine kinase [Paenibacillus cremeus]TVY08879.1 HAMP domain-containing histidine kinase [Paenibacillus cremeus]